MRNATNKVMMAMIWNVGIKTRQDIQNQLELDILTTVKEFVGQQHP